MVTRVTGERPGEDLASEGDGKTVVVLMPGRGLEPPLTYVKRILNPPRLPIPPPGLRRPRICSAGYGAVKYKTRPPAAKVERGPKRGRCGSLVSCALALTACAAPSGAPDSSSASRFPAAPSKGRAVSDGLYTSYRSDDFAENPRLLERIVKSPHGYYRFVNIRFSQEVCRRLADPIAEAPRVNLHGDAHLEQYAITDLGRGLTDFDDSTAGPGVIDLARFGVSLRLACREKGWESHEEALFARFIEGYRAALRNPDFSAPEPRIVREIQKGFKEDRENYFAWVSSIMRPFEPGERDRLAQSLGPYVQSINAQEGGLPNDFFRIEQGGRLRMGIGSALDEKFILRVKGRTDDPLDDVVLEIKEVRDLTGIDCIVGGSKNDPFRILIAQSRIAYVPYRFLGYLRMGPKYFWVHSWVDNYRELSIGKLQASPDELGEVAFDVGVQLGRGHANQIAAPHDAELRRAQLRLIDRHQAMLAEATAALAAETVDAWTRFRGEARRQGLIWD